MLTPSTEADLAEIVRGANAPLSIRGGGTRGSLPNGEPLTTSGLTGITLYEPGALTLIARAGTPVAEIEAALAAEGQGLFFEPPDHRVILGTEGTPTIGGAVALNASGPRRLASGACRDAMIGVRFVDGTGAVVKNGGRVMKNVTGYDLVKLMAGSRGTLGIMTEVAFKVLPAPVAAAMLTLRGLKVADAVRVMAAALSSPFEVTGAAHDPSEARTLLRIEGFADSVAYRADRLTDLLTPFGDVGTERDPGTVRATWAAIRDAHPFKGTEGDLWRIVIRPSHAPPVAEALGDAKLLFDWGGGLVWAETDADVRAALAGIPGHATRVRARGRPVTDLSPEAPQIAALSAGLRAKFDPRGILNPEAMASAA